MRAMVTGDTGFIGHVLKNRLHETGWDVCGLRSRGKDVDLRDAVGVENAIREGAPEVLFHLAGVSGPMLMREDPASVLSINGVGTWNVISAAARFGVSRIIYGGSVSAYASEEGREPVADSFYGVTKRIGELLVAHLRRETGVETTSVRIGSVYGPGRTTFNPIHEMVRQAKHDGIVRFNKHERDPIIWIDDCAQLLARLAALPELKPSYDAVTEVLSHEEAARVVADALGVPVQSFDGDELPYPFPFTLIGEEDLSTGHAPLKLGDAIARIAALP